MKSNPPPRISDEEALDYLKHKSTPALMAQADALRRQRHGNQTYYVHSHNLNPTNRCVVQCELCSFWRADEATDAYVMSLEDARKNLEKAQGWGLTDLHIVGGMVPELDLTYYEKLFSLARKLLPDVLLQGMTAVEIDWIAEQAKVSVQETLQRLQAVGFGAMSGGGAEIFHPEIRQKIAAKKISADRWLAVHRTAHALGIPTNATMLFGHIESDEHIIDHLSQLRKLQDETGGFQAIIPIPFQANSNALNLEFGPSGDRQVRVAALTRIYMDNVPHVRMLVNYMDRKLLGVLTHSGVDDIGGTSLNERVAKAAGAPQSQKFFSAEEMESFLVNHGWKPVLTNSIYKKIPPPTPQTKSVPLWKNILERIEEGERLTPEEAIILHDHAPFQELGRVANLRRKQIVPGNDATFVVDKNLNLTNICITQCKFCAFYVDPESPNGYVLSPDEVVKKVSKAAKAGATQILLQGGIHPDLGLDYYEACLKGIRDHVDIWIHSLSPTEIDALAQKENGSIQECLIRLRDAGLQSLPGGGAEILVDEIRQKISPKKTSASRWFDVMKTAHQLGMKSTATMVYGFGETTAQRIEHWIKIRDLQDQTSGFTAFIPWSFSPHKTNVTPPRLQNGIDYLRIIALSRLILDNIPHLQAGWVTEGPDVAQLALQFGADDFGGILMTEEVVSATGLNYGVNRPQVLHLIRQAGWNPVQRTTQYKKI